MANFTTHIAAGTVVSGALATLTLAADVVAPENLVVVTLAGVLGSVMPDIDLSDSRASRLFFSGIGIFASFCALFLMAGKLSIAELWIVWLGTLVFARYGLHIIFHRIAVHRGVWHSLLAATFCSVATAVFLFHVLGRHEGVAWLGGGFMFIGFIVHLLLDEIYSVDAMNRRVKRSFGTAMKIIDSNRPWHSAAMALATAIAITAAPPTQTFVDGISSRDLWAGLQQRLLPEDKWFGVFGSAGGMVAVPQDGTSQITTGSVPEAAAPVQPDAQ